MSCGVELEANQLLTDLTAGEDFDIPVIDLDGPEYQLPPSDNDAVVPITIEQLTTGVVGGTGVFDKIMTTMRAHLKSEVEQNRISGNEYVKAYLGMTEAALNGSLQFLLGKDQAYWQSRQAQAQALTAAVQLETAKVQAAAVRNEAAVQKANFALAKIKLSGESVAYCTAQYNLDTMLPQQLMNLQAQEQLYIQQKTSYIRDGEIKAAKLWSDAWITQKTLDEGLVPPSQFTNAEVDEVLSTIKLNNQLGTV